MSPRHRGSLPPPRLPPRHLPSAAGGPEASAQRVSPTLSSPALVRGPVLVRGLVPAHGLFPGLVPVLVRGPVRGPVHVHVHVHVRGPVHVPVPVHVPCEPSPGSHPPRVRVSEEAAVYALPPPPSEQIHATH